MGDAIGQMLASAVGIAISPVPLITVVLMLATPRGRVNGTAFAASWVLCLGVVVTAVVLAGAGADASGDEGPATWTLWLKLVLGVLFLLLGVKQWKDRPREGHEAEQPGWMKAIDQFTPGKAAGLAALLAVVRSPVRGRRYGPLPPSASGSGRSGSRCCSSDGSACSIGSSSSPGSPSPSRPPGG